MIYTSNLNILKAEVSSIGSASIGADPTTVFQVCNSSYELLDSILSAYTYQVITDSNISITTESICIIINDPSLLLSTTRNLSITSTSDRQLRFITNSTNNSLVYGSITLLPGKTYVTYDGITTTNGSISIYDIYSFTPGKPAIDTILVSKKILVSSILTGVSAKSSIASTSNTTYDIWLNTVKVGYIKFLSASTTGTIALFGTIYLNIGDNLFVKTQGIQDATLSDVGIVLNIIGE
ncbi:MAG: hypothetical protein WCT07_04790 [Candidatus Paceibacterota bacterium]|jgi:hypothetical protein